MILSLPTQELYEYVNAQTGMYFPDGCTRGGDRGAFDLALERLEYCFSHISTKGYQENGQARFYHLHMDQYSAFLYYYANSIWKLEGNTAFADKLILLNRALSGMWFSYKNNLPDIFLFMHPVGTVLGNANYSDLGECKIVCVKSNCADLFYAPYWGKQLKGWISNGKT